MHVALRHEEVFDVDILIQFDQLPKLDGCFCEFTVSAKLLISILCRQEVCDVKLLYHFWQLKSRQSVAGGMAREPFRHLLFELDLEETCSSTVGCLEDAQ